MRQVGCWVGYELLLRIRDAGARVCVFALFCRSPSAARACMDARVRAGLPLPALWLLSAMPAPDLPAELRPWRRGADLDDHDFKVRA